MAEGRQAVPRDDRSEARLDCRQASGGGHEVFGGFETLHLSCLTFARFDRKTRS